MDESEEKYWFNLEKVYVHNQYNNFYNKDKLEHNFDKSIDSTVNNSEIDNAWPKVRKFIKKLEPNSLIADIGCGEGKYMNLNNSIFSIGCDRSSTLCEMALTNQNNHSFISNQILVCDNLALPFRSNLFDAVISIGVIHHFSTVPRRTKSVQELCRILKPGGKLMIYVWAMEQRTRKFNSQDILVPLISDRQIETSKSPPINIRRDLSRNSKSDFSQDNIQRFNSSLKNQQKIKQTTTNTRTNSLESKTIDSKLKESSNLGSNKNFVDNFKLFIAKKFTVEPIEKNKSPMIPSQNGCDTSSELSKSMDSKTIERYRKILDEHKDVLPKNFEIRSFPYSSCQDTFNENFDLNKLITASNNSIEENKNVTISEETKDLNKRFYHVFKANELDMLVNSSCSELSIYDSYYDHGNWCICATKNEL